MFGKIFNSAKDLNYVKITKSNWEKIENLLVKKENTIQELEKTLKMQTDRLKELEKYKANDDLLYSYEETCKKYKNENTQLKKELIELNTCILKMDKKVQSVLSLESAYIQRIIKAESKTRYNACPEYQEVGQGLVEFYA